MNANTRFTVIQSVGRDELGEVSESIENETGRLAALKVFDSWTMASDAGRSAYRQALQKLHSFGPARTPRTIAVHIEKTGGWIANDWLRSASLDTYIRQFKGIDPTIAAGVACGILDCLQELHDAGLVHGGMSSGKVLLTQGFAPTGVVITDPFQHHLYSVSDPLATAAKASAPFFGYAKYLSPEQAKGEAPDQRSDIYVVGLLLYEMLTGAPAFQGASPVETIQRQISGEQPSVRAVRPDVKLSADLEQILEVALAKDPASRFQSALAMRRALAHCRNADEDDTERFATPLGYARGEDIRELFITKDEDQDAIRRAEAERVEREAAAALAQAEAAAAAAAAAAAEARAAEAAAQEAARAAVEKAEREEREHKEKLAAEQAAVHAVMAAAAQGQAEASQAATSKKDGKKAKGKKASSGAGLDDPMTMNWFREGGDAARMSEMHSDGDVPTLTEINQAYSRTSRTILIAAMVLLTVIAVAAIKLGQGSGKSDQRAAIDASAPVTSNEG